MKKNIIHPKEFGKLFGQERFKEIYNVTSNEFQNVISKEDFIDLTKSFNKDVVHYELDLKMKSNGLHFYIWVNDQKDKAISVAFDIHHQIQSLLLRPLVTYSESDHSYTQNTYRMPIEGEWFVFWGGVNEMFNYHYPYESQRYAYDLVKSIDHQTYKTTDSSNEHFYAFNEKIVVPASGTVVKVIDGFEDNVPGEMDATNVAGNYVIIEHNHKEYSMLAHLKKNSIKVKVGDQVKEGQFIGKCGNSGHSSEPHVHFQIMDSSDFEQAKSIRIRFKDGNEPVRGDIISN